mgnify:CR=1 FL=1
MIRRTTRSTLLPDTTLVRSGVVALGIVDLSVCCYSYKNERCLVDLAQRFVKNTNVVCAPIELT